MTLWMVDKFGKLGIEDITQAHIRANEEVARKNITIVFDYKVMIALLVKDAITARHPGKLAQKSFEEVHIDLARTAFF